MKTQNQKIKKKNNESQPFLSHLAELRSRIFICLAFFIAFSGIGYYLNTYIISFLTAPIHEKLFFTSPTGGFDIIFRSSLFFALIATLPIITYHILKFIKPAFPKKFTQNISKIILLSAVLGLIGFLFAYYITLPATFIFLDKFEIPQVQALLTFNEYFSFITRYLIAFSIIFQFPLILFIINQIYPLSFKNLFSYQKYIILGSFIFAAIITPTPDIFNQTIFALPIIILYNASLFILWISRIKNRAVARKRNKRHTDN